MVHVFGLRIFVVLVVVHNTVSQHIIHHQKNDATLKSRNDLQHESYTSYAQHQSHMSTVKRPPFDDPTPLIKHHTYSKSKSSATEISVKQPDEKIIHHPSSIYVNRPPTFVTINHPDIVIEPNPVVYHKPAAVVRSPVVYKTLPRAVKYRHVVKHIVKPIEKKVVLEERTHAKGGQYASQSQMFKPEIFSERQQVHFLNEQSNASDDAREINVSANATRRISRVINRQPTDGWNQMRQQEKINESNELQGEIIEVIEGTDEQLDLNHIYEQKFQQN